MPHEEIEPTATIEAEVRQSLATDQHYPLGEPDALKWAIAFRILNGDKDVDDDLMAGWFANAMATAEMRATGGSFLNADGMQSILDGEMEAHPELCR
jgi:hypothetical protein